MKIRMFFVIFSFVTYFSYGQKVTNVKAELIGTDVNVTFDLVASKPSDLFEVKLFVSHNNFTDRACYHRKQRTSRTAKPMSYELYYLSIQNPTGGETS